MIPFEKKDTYILVEGQVTFWGFLLGSQKSPKNGRESASQKPLRWNFLPKKHLKGRRVQSHRIHGTICIFTYIDHKNQPNVGIYTSPMDPMGMILRVDSFSLLRHVDAADCEVRTVRARQGLKSYFLHVDFFRSMTIAKHRKWVDFFWHAQSPLT